MADIEKSKIKHQTFEHVAREVIGIAFVWQELAIELDEQLFVDDTVLALFFEFVEPFEYFLAREISVGNQHLNVFLCQLSFCLLVTHFSSSSTSSIK
mgnify:CR=1 FL=1